MPELEEELQMFQTYGPYEMSAVAHEVDSLVLEGFWDEVEASKEGLSQARGIYIFATSFGKKMTPWYVGKTDGSFKARFTQHLRSPHIFRALTERVPNRKLQVFFIARVSGARHTFIRTKNKNLKSSGHLEQLLIASVISLNPNPVNTKEVKFSRDLVVPGYLNDDRRKRNHSAKQLAVMLGTQ